MVNEKINHLKSIDQRNIESAIGIAKRIGSETETVKITTETRIAAGTSIVIEIVTKNALVAINDPLP
jgi:transcriptional/translational regulatory protein YebC/TACO1